MKFKVSADSISQNKTGRGVIISCSNSVGVALGPRLWSGSQNCRAASRPDELLML